MKYLQWTSLFYYSWDIVFWYYYNVPFFWDLCSLHFSDGNRNLLNPVTASEVVRKFRPWSSWGQGFFHLTRWNKNVLVECRLHNHHLLSGGTGCRFPPHFLKKAKFQYQSYLWKNQCQKYRRRLSQHGCQWSFRLHSSGFYYNARAYKSFVNKTSDSANKPS